MLARGTHEKRLAPFLALLVLAACSVKPWCIPYPVGDAKVTLDPVLSLRLVAIGDAGDAWATEHPHFPPSNLAAAIRTATEGKVDARAGPSEMRCARRGGELRQGPRGGDPGRPPRITGSTRLASTDRIPTTPAPCATRCSPLSTGISTYLGGHDHDIERFEDKTKPVYVVSGSASKVLEDDPEPGEAHLPAGPAPAGSPSTASQ